eukprot:UN03219
MCIFTEIYIPFWLILHLPSQSKVLDISYLKHKNSVKSLASLANHI